MDFTLSATELLSMVSGLKRAHDDSTSRTENARPTKKSNVLITDIDDQPQILSSTGAAGPEQPLQP